MISKKEFDEKYVAPDGRIKLAKLMKDYPKFTMVLFINDKKKFKDMYDVTDEEYRELVKEYVA